MITNNDVNEFIGNLSQHLQVLITRIGNQESWSSDNEDDVNSLINELSEALEKTHPDTLSRASHLLLTNSAYFTLPRFLKFITFIAEKNPRAVNQMLSPLNKEKVVDGEVYLNTVLSRLRYLIQSILVSEIFSPETMKRVQLAVLEHERIKNSSETYGQKQAIPCEDNLDIDDFDNDMPYAAEDSEVTSEENQNIDSELNNSKTSYANDVANDIEKTEQEKTNDLSNIEVTDIDKSSNNHLKSEKHATGNKNYEFKKKAVLDLLNQIKDEANQSD